MTLRAVNLNLLPVLQALLHEKSVSGAAETLAMSQSAASEALAKLRAAFDDPLLVRVGSRMELTQRAVALVDPLGELCRNLEMFHRHPSFDAANARRTFTIVSNDYATVRLAPPLLATLRSLAPGVTVRFQNGNDNLVSDLSAGALDLAIIPRFFLTDIGDDMLRFHPLFADRAVAIFDRAHPLAGRQAVTQADLDAYRMIAFHPGSMKIERRHLHAFSGGIPFRIAAFVPEVTLVPYLVRGTQDFGIIPAGYRVSPDMHADIVECDLAFDMPPLEVGMAWGSVQDEDSGHKWLRALVEKSFHSQMALASAGQNGVAQADPT